MGFIEKAIQWFLFGFQDTPEKRIESKVVLLNFMGVLFIFTVFCFALFFFFNSKPIMGVIDLVFVLLFAVNFISFNRSKRFYRYAYSFVTLVSILFIYSIVFYDLGSESGLIWLFFIPPIAFFFLGRKPGILFSIIILILASVLLWTPEHPMNILHYSLPFKIHFTLVYLLLLSILYGYDKIQTMIINNLNKSKEIAENTNRAKEEFISKLSHQIRTPLNDIVVLGDLLSSEHLNKKQKDLVETVIASTNNLVNVVNSITEDSGVEITYKKKEHIKFDLLSTITSITDLISRTAPSEIDIKLPVLDDTIPYLMGDSIVLKQILLYLFDTVIKSQADDALKIEMNVIHQSESDHTVEIKFEIEVIPKLVMQIQGLDMGSRKEEEDITPKETDKLDISIVQKLIELKGGRLRIESDERCSRFSFSLPFDKALEDEKIPISKEKVVSIDKFKKKPKVELKNSNILLVEDNLINQKIVVLSLKQLVRNIDLASDGKEALDKFGTSKYDVILMDIQMPVMNGIIATKKIREIESSTNSHTPIVAITANAMLGDRETCLSAGMDEYISKPFQLEDLLHKIKSLLA